MVLLVKVSQFLKQFLRFFMAGAWGQLGACAGIARSVLELCWNFSCASSDNIAVLLSFFFVTLENSLSSPSCRTATVWIKSLWLHGLHSSPCYSMNFLGLKSENNLVPRNRQQSLSRGPHSRHYYVKPVPGLLLQYVLRIMSIRNLHWESQLLVKCFDICIKAEKDAAFGTAGFTGCTRSVVPSWPKIPPTHWHALPRRHVSRRQGDAATITDADGPT